MNANAATIDATVGSFGSSPADRSKRFHDLVAHKLAELQSFLDAEFLRLAVREELIDLDHFISGVEPLGAEAISPNFSRGGNIHGRYRASGFVHSADESEVALGKTCLVSSLGAESLPSSSLFAGTSISQESVVPPFDQPSLASSLRDEEQMLQVAEGTVIQEADGEDSSRFANGAMEATLTSMSGIPDRAFVINVRRLIKMKQVFALLHELVKSTAIAAITLVSAASQRQLLSTIVFLSSVFILYVMHETHWDTLDIEDIDLLLPFLTDDAHEGYHGENPNRLLKAVSRATSRRLKNIWMCCNVALAGLLALTWMICGNHWRKEFGFTFELGEMENVISIGTKMLIQNENDAEVLGTFLMVGSLMFILHCLFEYLQWRETSAVLPLTPSNETWDPRRHGSPFGYWLLGIPSMWFTSQETFERLREYIDMATPGQNVVSIFPQEFATFALSGGSQRRELEMALTKAKKFDAMERSFVFDERTQDVQSLGIELCFFDTYHKEQSLPYNGVYHYASDEGPKREVIAVKRRERKSSGSKDLITSSET